MTPEHRPAPTKETQGTNAADANTPAPDLRAKGRAGGPERPAASGKAQRFVPSDEGGGGFRRPEASGVNAAESGETEVFSAFSAQRSVFFRAMLVFS
jgi:hypothetical protein